MDTHDDVRSADTDTDSPPERWLRDAIAGWRLAWGLTQSEVAQRLDVTRQTIAGWESGAALPHRQLIIFAYQALEQTIRKEKMEEWEKAHRSAFSEPPASLYEPTTT